MPDPTPQAELKAPLPCPKCRFEFEQDRLPIDICYHTSDNTEFIVICPRCGHDGELKATPEWAIAAWNKRAPHPTPASDAVYLRDLDGTGSMHVCAKGDPGAIAFSPLATAALAAQGGWREALAAIASQPTADEMTGVDGPTPDEADFEGGYNHCVETARAALSEQQEG